MDTQTRRVAIVFINPLFAQGIACLLETEPHLQVVCIDARNPDAAEGLRRLEPQVVLVEQDSQGSALCSVPMQLFSHEGWMLLIVLGLQAPEMEMFYKRRVRVATPDTLLQAVLEEGDGLHC